MPSRAKRHRRRESLYPYEACVSLRREDGETIERACDALGIARSTLCREIMEQGLAAMDQALKTRIKRARRAAAEAEAASAQDAPGADADAASMGAPA